MQQSSFINWDAICLTIIISNEQNKKWGQFYPRIGSEVSGLEVASRDWEETPI